MQWVRVAIDGEIFAFTFCVKCTIEGYTNPDAGSLCKRRCRGDAVARPAFSVKHAQRSNGQQHCESDPRVVLEVRRL